MFLWSPLTLRDLIDKCNKINALGDKGIAADVEKAENICWMSLKMQCIVTVTAINQENNKGLHLLRAFLIIQILLVIPAQSNSSYLRDHLHHLNVLHSQATDRIEARNNERDRHSNRGLNLQPEEKVLVKSHIPSSTTGSRTRYTQ